MSWLPRWTFKQWVARILVGFVVLLLLLTALALWIGQDEELLDDSDLRIAPAEGRDYQSEDNGYQRLVALSEALQKADREPYLEDLLEAQNGEPDWEAIRERLTEVQPTLDQIEHILAAPYFTLEWPTHPGVEFLGISEALWLARWQAAKARLSVHDGLADQGWRECDQILQLGNRVVTGDAALVNFLVGQSIQAVVIEVIQENVLALAPNVVVSKQRTDKLKSYRFTKEVVSRIFRFEYMWARSAFAQVNAGNSSLYGEPSWLTWLLYKPHQTRNLMLRHYGSFIENLDLPAKEINLLYMPKVREGLTLEMMVSGNVTGHILIRLSLPAVYTILRRILETNSQLQLTRLGLALAGYANEHGGALPEKLAALAPLYIDAVPLDPITGEAFFYDREQRKVWSVGKDLNDDGGVKVEWADRDQPHDLVVEIPELTDAR